MHTKLKFNRPSYKSYLVEKLACTRTCTTRTHVPTRKDTAPVSV